MSYDPTFDAKIKAIGDFIATTLFGENFVEGSPTDACFLVGIIKLNPNDEADDVYSFTNIQTNLRYGINLVANSLLTAEAASNPPPPRPNVPDIGRA